MIKNRKYILNPRLSGRRDRLWISNQSGMKVHLSAGKTPFAIGLGHCRKLFDGFVFTKGDRPWA
jgi:hypothetical protein